MSLHKIGLIFCIIVSVFSSVCNSTENKLPNFTGNVMWESGSDFAAGYFDVFYEGGLFYALPSIYSNNLVNTIVNHEKASNCDRKPPVELSKLITVGQKNIYKLARHALLYKNREVVGKISDVSIDGIKGWRLPTYNEIVESSHSAKLEYGLCIKTLPNGNWNSDAFYSSGFNVMTYTRGHVGSRGEITDHMYIYDKNKGWRAAGYDWPKAFAVLARNPTKIEKLVFGDSQLDYMGRILKYAELRTNEELTPKRFQVDKPALAEDPSKPVLTKDEFETTVVFESRVSSANDYWVNESNKIHKANNNLMKEYDKKLNNAELKYENDVKLFSSSEYKINIYSIIFKEAVRMVLGQPYFKEFKYDADLERMTAVVFSARSPEFKKKVSFSVPLSTARSFKSELQNNQLIPLVELNSDLSIASVDAVTNKHKITLDYSIAKSQNTKKHYISFMSTYPNSTLAIDARLELDKLKEKAKKEDRERKLAEEKRDIRLAAEREAERQNYLIRKRVGDQVCRPGRVAFGLIGMTISAYVERVDRDRVQLRIGSTEGQSIYYNGVNLRNGVLIWDDYYEWKRCR